MVEPLTKLGNYLQQHENGIDLRWTAKVIEEARQQHLSHLQHVEEFLQEMYATMVDPVEQQKLTVAETCALLLKRAREDREIIAAHCPRRAQPELEMREGWMDSIDFEHEVGHALGGNAIYPSEADLREHRKCLDTDGECTAMRVYVVNADEYDKVGPRRTQPDLPQVVFDHLARESHQDAEAILGAVRAALARVRFRPGDGIRLKLLERLDVWMMELDALQADSPGRAQPAEKCRNCELGLHGICLAHPAAPQACACSICAGKDNPRGAQPQDNSDKKSRIADRIGISLQAIREGNTVSMADAKKLAAGRSRKARGAETPKEKP